jgi:septation ring formation regulator EzrA
MPSASDFYHRIEEVRDNTKDIKDKLDITNGHLATIEGKLDAIDTDVKKVDADIKKVQQLLLWGFQQLITIGNYTNQALFHNNQQNDTMICQLQQIAENTCCTCNEAHVQTGLQEEIKTAIRKLTDLFAVTHGEAAITLEREEELRRQIEACCPPEPPPVACVERPCAKPEPFDEKPPRTEPPPRQG